MHYASSNYFPSNGEGPARRKEEIGKDLRIVAMIEDNPGFAYACAQHGIQTYLVKQPWNRTLPAHPQITLVDSLEHAATLLSSQQPLKTMINSDTHGITPQKL